MNIWTTIVKHHRKALIGITVVVVLLTGLHLFITKKTALILEKIVSEASKGKYTLEINSVELGYFPENIHVTNIRIHPSQESLTGESYRVELDTLHVRIRSIWPLIFKKTIDIEDMSFVNPSLVIRGKKNKTRSSEKGLRLNENLLALQEGMHKVISIFKLERFRIDNLSLKIYTDSDRYFLVDRIFLHMDDMLADVASNQEKGDLALHGNVHLWLDKPNLIYPDSNLAITLDHFDWDTRKSRFALENIGFTWRRQREERDSIHIDLHEVELRKLNWSVWANTGQLQFDSIIANSGKLTIAMLNKPMPKDTGKVSKSFLSVISPLSTNHFEVSEIHSTATLRTATKPVVVSMKGDSLKIADLAIDTAKGNPIEVGSLDLAVREFQGRDESGRWQSTFSSFLISKDHIALRDFKLKADAAANLHLKNLVEVPRLDMSGLSIPRLVEGKLAIDELSLDRPSLHLVTAKKTKENKETRFAFHPLKNQLQFLNINRVRVQNGTYESIDAKTGNLIIQTNGVYGLIYANKLLAAKSVQALPDAFGKLGLSKFYFHSSEGKLELSGLQLVPARRIITVSSLNYRLASDQGTVELRNVQLELDSINNLAEKKKALYVKMLRVDSGSVALDLQSSAGKPPKSRENEIPFQIHHIQISHIGIKLRNERQSLHTNLYSLNLDSISNPDSYFKWTKAEAALDQTMFTTKEWSLKANAININNEGISTISQAIFQFQKPGQFVNISAPSINCQWPVHDSKTDEIHVALLQITKPNVSFSEITAMKKDSSRPSSGRNQKPNSITLDSLDLDEAVIAFDSHKDSSAIEVRTGIHRLTISGASILHQPEKDPQIDIAHIRILAGPAQYRRDSNIHVAAAGLNTHLLHFQKPASPDPMNFVVGDFFLDSVQFRQVKGEKKTSLDVLRLAMLDSTTIHANKDSLMHLAYSMPSLDLQHADLLMDNPKTTVQFRNVNANLKSNKLSLDSFSVTNKISRDSFFAAQPFEKDYLTFSSGRLEVDGFKIEKNAKDTGFLINKINVNNLFIKAERDKLRPDDTASYKPMFVGLTKKIPIKVSIDTLALQRTTIWHNVIAKKTGEQGTIFFTDVHGWVSNIKNYKYSQDDTLRIRVNALLMGQGNLYMRFRESYMDSLQGFLMTARMGKFEMPELNKILVPLILIKITKGHIDTLWLQARANELFAFGQMQIDYRKLHVEKLDLQQKKQGFISWVANIIVRTNNEKDGTIYIERLQNKSIFNYWGRIALSGLLTNIRVASNRKHRKKYEEALNKYNLPPHLLEEDK